MQQKEDYSNISDHKEQSFGWRVPRQCLQARVKNPYIIPTAIQAAIGKLPSKEHASLKEIEN